MNALIPLVTRLSMIVVVVGLTGCATFILRQDVKRSVIAATDDYTIVMAQPHDTFRSLAEQYLGDQSQDWVIADFNQLNDIRAGQEIIIPHHPHNPIGVYPDGYQTVPILVYHRFGRKPDRLALTPEMFEAQMAYLQHQGYRVIRLSDMHAFLQGHGSLPKKAVVITIDDGFKSAYTIAYPILKKYGFPATLFVYSSFIGLPGGLSWTQMREMVDSSLIDIQSHSKTHTNLALKQADESPEAYERRIQQEIQHPARQIKRHLQLSVHTFSYPYGDANDIVVEQLKKSAYRMAATVQRGGNACFADPLRLRRTLIYGDEPLETFKKRLEVFRLIKRARIKQVTLQSGPSMLPPTCLTCDPSRASLVRYHREVASQLTTQGDLAAALIQWKILRVLEDDSAAVRRQLAILRERIQQEVERLLRTGIRALQHRKYKLAQRVFLTALALNPFEEQPRVYLQQLERARMRRWLRNKIDKLMSPEGKM